MNFNYLTPDSGRRCMSVCVCDVYVYVCVWQQIIKINKVTYKFIPIIKTEIINNAFINNAWIQTYINTMKQKHNKSKLHSSIQNQSDILLNVLTSHIKWSNKYTKKVPKFHFFKLKCDQLIIITQPLQGQSKCYLANYWKGIIIFAVVI